MARNSTIYHIRNIFGKERNAGILLIWQPLRHLKRHEGSPYEVLVRSAYWNGCMDQPKIDLPNVSDYLHEHIITTIHFTLWPSSSCTHLLGTTVSLPITRLRYCNIDDRWLPEPCNGTVVIWDNDPVSFFASLPFHHHGFRNTAPKVPTGNK